MEILRTKNARSWKLTEMKNAFAGFISRLDTAEERISGLEDISTETSKTEKQREKRQTPNNKKQTQN